MPQLKMQLCSVREKVQENVARIACSRDLKFVSNSSNWSEWNTIQGIIARVISKSDEQVVDLKVRARFLPELYDTMSNY